MRWLALLLLSACSPLWLGPGPVDPERDWAHGCSTALAPPIVDGALAIAGAGGSLAVLAPGSQDPASRPAITLAAIFLASSVTLGITSGLGLGWRARCAAARTRLGHEERAPPEPDPLRDVELDY